MLFHWLYKYDVVELHRKKSTIASVGQRVAVMQLGVENDPREHLKTIEPEIFNWQRGD